MDSVGKFPENDYFSGVGRLHDSADHLDVPAAHFSRNEARSAGEDGGDLPVDLQGLLVDPRKSMGPSGVVPLSPP